MPVSKIAYFLAGTLLVCGGARAGASPLSPTPVNASVTEQWVARYDGPSHLSDRASAIAVDAAGHVFVTGASTGVTGNWEYATIKYDAATGAQIWIARYIGPGNGDAPWGIAVDSVGDVYVTGISTGVGTGWDYATIKYDGTTGAQLWIARYDGPAHGDDAATNIALDATGNVYVTGYSTGIGTGYDYATVKYDGTTGAQLWVARYNGPANRDDYSWALALDADGNVFVIGAVDGAGTERWEVIRDELNRYLRGWGAYFAYDSHWPSFRKLDQHVWDRARNFLRRRHRLPSGTARFSYAEVFHGLGVLEMKGLLR